VATLVVLTDFWSVHRGTRIPMEVVVNLDLVKTMLRLPERPASEVQQGLAERTQLWFGGAGADDSETVLVTETLYEVIRAWLEAR
jgi:hypothetical protein